MCWVMETEQICESRTGNRKANWECHLCVGLGMIQMRRGGKVESWILHFELLSGVQGRCIGQDAISSFLVETDLVAWLEGSPKWSNLIALGSCSNVQNQSDGAGTGEDKLEYENRNSCSSSMLFKKLNFRRQLQINVSVAMVRLSCLPCRSASQSVAQQRPLGSSKLDCPQRTCKPAIMNQISCSSLRLAKPFSSPI